MQLHGVEKYKLFPNHERSAVHHIRFFFLLIIEGGPLLRLLSANLGG